MSTKNQKENLIGSKERKNKRESKKKEAGHLYKAKNQTLQTIAIALIPFSKKPTKPKIFLKKIELFFDQIQKEKYNQIKIIFKLNGESNMRFIIYLYLFFVLQLIKSQNITKILTINQICFL
ncbi:transmembrane protein, putative (macronuclear) [Tetrahymena thermophila SB210]|uniref:Transmembrane protein, putative n=1 Tax=Tetrahymena thermophila (strain SB210) TaxID=312017 RepID=W7X8X6_TETTS|nr:transmembrane protein, putative [Tetrahymena thermophila SB210]EWS72838.1 transmembrane protein, putative [Tetrahymena thermophila SB210]|eukprot:XP_012654629.1 transmembrane protein, putative [Tetrahymena thermophila SB210]